MPRAEKACDHPRDPAGTMCPSSPGQTACEPELENLKGVDRWNVVDDVHDLCQGHLRKGSDQQVKHHSLAGDVAGLELGIRESKPSGRLGIPEGGQVQLAGVWRSGWHRLQRGMKPDVANDIDYLDVQAAESIQGKSRLTATVQLHCWLLLSSMLTYKDL
jgi:hypothetical protein